jgi:hypothetical protein
MAFLMPLIWILVIRRYAADWPFWDELSYLRYTVGAQPLTWDVLWAHHNGHRILIPKLVYFGVMKLSGYHPAVLMSLNVAFLTFGALCVIVALRRTLGRHHVLDALVVLAALAFSQYHNILWAFQIFNTISAGLVLLAIAVATRIERNTDRGHLMVLGAIAALLPVCGGTGMGMAPGFVLWLLAVGLVHLARGADRADRSFGACALGSGVVAGAAWCLAIYGLPPSPALEILRDALRSWRAFLSLVSEVYATTVEFYSTPFIPDSMYRGLPFLDDGATWGHWGLFLLLSIVVILATAWVRRPRERLRISALGGCVVAFVVLTLVLYVSRGSWGRSAGASNRYSTVAMPLLVLSVVAYTLYGPKRLRMAVLSVTAAGLVVVLGGPDGNFAKLRALSSFERGSYEAFERELRRPGGTTIEELTGHFSAPLFEPGEARQVPGFIQLMAEHRVGPFRAIPVVPPHVSAWTASPFPIRADAAHGLTWDGRRALKSNGVHGVIEMRFPEPTRVSALRLTFRAKGPSAGPANIFVSWRSPDTASILVGRTIRWPFWTANPAPQVGTAYVFADIERLDIGLSTGFTEWELLASERLEPTATTQGVVAIRR